ncbi:unnamed protein product [Thelazia callipaeda]|uniref:Cathepsin L-like n=1 Tax=Thelazia callipaeda TaxID=103827 RepID=A0A0N5D8Y1_THECL|nr:unnamed protein product [Thelazia callipaeda]
MLKIIVTLLCTVEDKANESAEMEYRRFMIYSENVKKINDHNKRYKAGLTTYQKAINKFTNWLPEELSRLNGDRSGNLKYFYVESVDNVTFNTVHKPLPPHIDWRKFGAVTPVKDQGYCGSCWAFSATGALEAQHFMKTGVLIQLSEQNLMDCSYEYGNEGCDGGLAIFAYDYVQNNNGIDTEDKYPYEGIDGQCRYNVENRGTTCLTSAVLTRYNEVQLQADIVDKGPIAVSIDASYISDYDTGIFESSECSTFPNHAVLVVGYGSEEVVKKDKKVKKDYWIIKNSWGRNWGENGYLRLARNENNMCGVVTRPNVPYIQDKLNLKFTE